MGITSNFLTIRQTAKTGILTEHQLRLMEKQKRLPCIYIGEKQTRCLINYQALLQQLDTESRGSGPEDSINPGVNRAFRNSRTATRDVES